jgi:ABC-2 type transport system permease protein
MFALAFFAVMAGLDVTANDEDEGILDVLLALPIPRWQVIVERTLANAVIIVGIAMVEFLAMVIGTFITPLEIDLGKLFLGCVNLIPAAWILMAFTIFVSSIFSRKLIVTGIAAAFVLGSYMLNIIGSAVTEGSFGSLLGKLSVWTYFDVQKVIQNGLNPVNISGLLLLSVVLIVASTYLFERRDVA